MGGVDVRYRLVSWTHRLGSPPRFHAANDVSAETCQFASVYSVSADDAQAIHAEGTAEAFKGVAWSKRLWVDVDSYAGAARIEEKLKQLGVGYEAYDTGGRGAHFGILRSASPSHLLPLRDKLWVKEHLPDADPSLYWHLHLLRVEGAVHERTGRRKRLIRAVQGPALSLPPYTPSAEAVRTGPSPRAAVGGRRKSVFDCFAVMSNSSPATGGERHRQLVILAVALRDEAQVTEEEALWWCLEVNRSFGEPKDEGEVQRIVSWAYGDGAVGAPAAAVR